MRVFYIILIISAFTIDNIKGQSIPSFWMNVNEVKMFVTRNKAPKKITINSTNYYASGESYTEKFRYEFVDNNRIEGVHSKNDEELSQFTFIKDSLNRKIVENINTRYPAVGWKSNIVKYDYVGKNMSKEVVLDNNGIIRTVCYKYNKEGLIENISFYNKNNELESSENALYDYESNIFEYKVLNSENNVILSKLNFCITDTSENSKNFQGDYIKLVWPLSSIKNKVYKIIEYKYDKFDNWILRKVYSQSYGEMKIQSITKREIKYR